MTDSTSPTMRAAVTTSAGSRPEIQSRPIPQPGAGEVLVQVIASSVNPTDVMTWRRGAFVTGQEVPFVGGYDMAGVVAAVGRGVTVLRVGDAVAGMPRFPAPAAAFAEFAVVPARHVAPLPTVAGDISTAEWGCWSGLPLAGLTAYQALVDTARVQPGHRVLVHAASGGVGHVATQLAIARGAEVTAVTSARGYGLVEALGAHHMVDRSRVDWSALLGCFDIVLDTVGGETTRSSLALATAEGIVVALHPYAHDDLAAQDPRLRRMLVEPDHHALRTLIDLTTAGAIRVHVGAQYHLQDLGDALAHVGLDKSPGKTIIFNQGAIE